MANEDIGLFFETKSFKSYNKLLSDFQTTSKLIDSTLISMAHSVNKMEGSLKSISTLDALNSTVYKDFGNAIVSMHQAIRSVNFDRFTKFSESLKAIVEASNISSGNLKENLLEMKDALKVFDDADFVKGFETNFRTLRNIISDMGKISKSLPKVGATSFSLFIKDFVAGINEIAKVDFSIFDKVEKTGNLGVIRDFLYAFGGGKNKSESIVGLLRKLAKIKNVTSLGVFSRTLSDFFNLINVVGEIKIKTETTANLESGLQILGNIVDTMFGKSYKQIFSTDFQKDKALIDNASKQFEDYPSYLVKFGKGFTNIGNVFRRFATTAFKFEWQDSLFARIKSFDKIAPALARLSTSIHQIVTAIKTMSTISFDPRHFLLLMENIGDIFTQFTGVTLTSRIGNFFNNRNFDSFVGLFLRGGIMSQLNRIDVNSFAKIEILSDAIFKFTNTTTELFSLKTFPNEAEIRDRLNSVKNVITILTETFTGIRGIDRTFAFFNVIRRKSNFTDIGDYFNKIGGLTATVEKVDDDSLENLSKLALSIKRFADSASELTEKDYDFERIRQNLRGVISVVSELLKMNIFDKIPVFGGGLASLFGRQSIFSKLKSIDVDALEKLTSVVTVVEKATNILSSANDYAGNTKNLEELSKTIKSIIVNVVDVMELDMTQVGKKAAKTFLAGFEEGMEIRSPSRAMMRIGKQAVEGLGIGLRGISKVVVAPIKVSLTVITKLYSTLKTIVIKSFTGVNNVINKVFSGIIGSAKGAVTNLGNVFNKIGNFAFRMNNIIDLFQRFRFDEIARSGIEFESSFAGVLKTLELTTEEANNLRTSIRDMATDASSPVSGIENAQNVLAGIAESAGQLGIAKEDVIEFTETIGALTLATDLTAESAASELARFANIIGNNDFGAMGATIVALGNNAATTESQIVEMSQRIAGIGKSAGISAPEIFAISTALSSVGIEAEAGGSSMTKIISEITDSVANGDLEYFTKVTKLSAEEFADTWRNEPVKALEIFLDEFGKLGAEEQVGYLDALGLDGIRVADSIRRLSGAEKGLSEYLDIANLGWEEQTALMDEAEKRNQTVQSSINRFRNSLRDVGITIFDIVRPAIVAVISGVTGFTNRINDFIIANSEVLSGITNSFVNIGVSIAEISYKFGEIFGHLTRMFIDSTTVTNEFGEQVTIIDRIKLALQSVGNYIQTLIANTQQFTNNMIIGLNAIRGISPLETMKQQLKQERDEAIAYIEEIRGYASRDYGGTQEQLITYDIQAGDTLTAIANANGISVADLMTANGLQSSLIIAGETLQIPTGEFVASTAPWNQEEIKAEYDTYKERLVEIDDELASISQKQTDESLISDDLLSKFEKLSQFVSDIKDGITEIFTSSFGDGLNSIADTIAGAFGFESQSITMTGVYGLETSNKGNPFSEKVTEWVEEFKTSSIIQNNIGNALDTVITAGVGFGLRLLVAPPLGILLSISTSLTNAIESDFLGLRTTLEQSEVGSAIVDAFMFINDVIDGAINTLIDTATGQSPISESTKELLNMGIITNDKALEKANNPFVKLVEFFQPIFDLIDRIVSPYVESAITNFTDKFIPSIQNMFTTISTTINSLFGNDGEEEGVKRLESLNNFLTGLADAVGSFAGTGVSVAGTLLEGGINFATSSIDTVIRLISNITDFVNALNDGSGTEQQKTFLQILLTLSNFGNDFAKNVIETARGLIEDLRNFKIGDTNPFDTFVSMVESLVFVIQGAVVDLQAALAPAQLTLGAITTEQADAIYLKQQMKNLGLEANRYLLNLPEGEKVDLSKIFTVTDQYGRTNTIDLFNLLQTQDATEFINSTNGKKLTDSINSMLDQIFANGADSSDFSILRYISSYSPEEIAKYDFSPIAKQIADAVATGDIGDEEYNIMSQYVDQAYLTDEQKNQLQLALVGVYEELDAGLQKAADESTIPADVGKGIGQDLQDAARDNLGVKSPSTVFYDIGGWVMQGLADGISSKLSVPMIQLQRFGWEILKTALSYKFATYGMIQDTIDLNDAMQDLVTTTTDLISKLGILIYTMSLLPTDLQLNVGYIPSAIPVISTTSTGTNTVNNNLSTTSANIIINAGSADANQVARLVQQQMNNPTSNNDLYRSRLIQQGGQGI